MPRKPTLTALLLPPSHQPYWGLQQLVDFMLMYKFHGCRFYLILQQKCFFALLARVGCILQWLYGLETSSLLSSSRNSALNLIESKWIIDGFYELIADFCSHFNRDMCRKNYQNVFFFQKNVGLQVYISESLFIEIFKTSKLSFFHHRWELKS